MWVRLPAVRRWTSIQVTTAIAAVVGVTASLVAAPNAQGMVGAGLALIMIAIAVVDARRFIIPDDLNIAALALAFVNATLVANDERASQRSLRLSCAEAPLPSPFWDCG